MFRSFYIIPFLFFHVCHAQTDSVIDVRDGQVYPTTIIGKKVWFKENIRFVTEFAYVPKFAKKIFPISQGNYYPFTDLDSVCPVGWHVATIYDWQEYISHVVKQGVRIKYDTLRNDDNSLQVKIDSAGLHLFNGNNPLNLTRSGWIEGNDHHNEQSLNLWIADTISHDRKYHAHIGPNGYIYHTHKHHIIDKPKNQRKFPVRCVCDIEK